MKEKRIHSISAARIIHGLKKRMKDSWRVLELLAKTSGKYMMSWAHEVFVQ